VTVECHKIMFGIVIENIYKLSVHRNGCRVVQTSFDVFSQDCQIIMINKLLHEGKIRDLCFDFNGNHVV
jgi:hypothetical protein